MILTVGGSRLHLVSWIQRVFVLVAGKGLGLLDLANKP